MPSFLYVLLLAVFAVVAVVALPRPQNRDTELIVGPPAAPASFAPFFLSAPGEGAVVGEVLVSSPNVAVKRSKDKKKNGGPSFAARVSPPADDNAVNSVGDTIVFSEPSAVIQTQ